MENYILELIKPELIILSPVLYIIGTLIKKSPINNNNIPLLLGVFGITLSGIWVFATSNIGDYQQVLLAIFTSFTQGVLIAGASVYVNQLKSAMKKLGCPTITPADCEKLEEENKEKLD